MSFVGGSISQAAALNNQDSRLSGLEGRATAVEARAGVVEGRVDALESRAGAVEARAGVVEARADALESRADAVEARATALESDIAGRVQAEINAKVAQATYDALAAELRNADSALTAAVATKVAITAQAAIDSAQDAAIASKKALSEYQAEKAALDAKDAAIEEFIRILLQTYSITKPNGQPYSYTGSVQNLIGAPAPAPAPGGSFAITITNIDRTTGTVTYNSTEDMFVMALKNGNMFDGGPFASGVGTGLTTVVFGVMTQFSNAGDTLAFAAPGNPNDKRSNTVTLV